ncbi:MAG TPA: thioredoxin family protein [Candidatus Competibacter sp.]|nr:thioredoxin family protein [Candidatus Competibacter sp.]
MSVGTTPRRVLSGLLLGLLLGWLLTPGCAASAAPAEWWATETVGGERRLHLYFFWTRTCPHCRAARPFVEALPADYPWLELHSHDITQDMAGALQYTRMAEALGESARSVPVFLFCGRMLTGFDRVETTGRYLRQQLEECHRSQIQPMTILEPAPPAEEPPLELPLVGKLDPATLSLPALTVVLAGLDAFNPCAFFVLLFLLSLLVHARSRVRMLLVGGVFVFFSGAIYFVFMAAWLNVFLLLGELRLVTVLAGLLAVILGGLNVKDYWVFQQGPSLGIADEAKPKLFKRMRALVGGEHLPSLLAGTVALAIVANSYELLCTAGFPMVYTRALTLHQLSAGTYYFYLAFYNLIYALPLLVIVLVFVWTLGSRKLREREGRLLKLLSGAMMVGLGLLLLFYPEGLSDAVSALLVIAAASALTGLAAMIEKRRYRRGSPM